MKVHALSRSELPTASSVLAAAFWEYPEALHLLPSEHGRKRVLPRYLGSDCTDSHALGTLLGATVDDTLVGVAAWLPPEGYPISLRRQLSQVMHVAPALPWGASALREALRGRHTNRQYHPSEPHYFLRALGVLPSHQGSGAGMALLQSILAQADERAVGCYLTTAKHANVGYYERYGFTVSSQYRPTARWPPVWSMWRDPQPPAPHQDRATAQSSAGQVAEAH